MIFNGAIQPTLSLLVKTLLSQYQECLQPFHLLYHLESFLPMGTGLGTWFNLNSPLKYIKNIALHD